ncbi:hypothetical protein U3516DRAFT_673621 [Neocallimastix sp. 'constans']
MKYMKVSNVSVCSTSNYSINKVIPNESINSKTLAEGFSNIIKNTDSNIQKTEINTTNRLLREYNNVATYKTDKLNNNSIDNFDHNKMNNFDKNENVTKINKLSKTHTKSLSLDDLSLRRFHNDNQDEDNDMKINGQVNKIHSTSRYREQSVHSDLSNDSYYSKHSTYSNNYEKTRKMSISKQKSCDNNSKTSNEYIIQINND